MKLNLLYTHKANLGYGRLGTDLHRGLAAAGVDVYDGIDGPEAEHMQGRHVGRCSNILYVSIPAHTNFGLVDQRRTIFTMWETTHVPPAFRSNIDHFDAVLVPSEQNLEMFSHYHPNVHYVPLAVDTKRWNFRPRREPGQYFNFLVAGSGNRKGADVVAAAFRHAFPKIGDGPIPMLTHKSPRRGELFGERINTVVGYISEADEWNLYDQTHCYVSGARGEGFGYQPLQAMAMGIPTILVNEHGHRAFADLGIPIGSHLTEADYFAAAGVGGAGDWWEPNVDEMVDAMRWVYDNYSGAVANAATSAGLVAEQFSLDATADGVLDVLGRDNLTGYEGSGEWVQANERRYILRVRIGVTSDHCGRRFEFERFDPERSDETTYWVEADVKRVIQDGGWLHPTCDEVALGRNGEWVDLPRKGGPVNIPVEAEPCTSS